jgi:hypothetical protein
MKDKPRKVFHINGHDIAAGDQVVALVCWPGGRTTITQGTLINVHEGEAFVESPLGPVAVDLKTVEPG